MEEKNCAYLSDIYEGYIKYLQPYIKLKNNNKTMKKESSYYN